MFEPQRVLISRHGEDANHARLQQVPAVVNDLPNVGDPLQMFLESGQVMRTSPVTHVAQNGNEVVVDTKNSRYSLKLAS